MVRQDDGSSPREVEVSELDPVDAVCACAYSTDFEIARGQDVQVFVGKRYAIAETFHPDSPLDTTLAINEANSGDLVPSGIIEGISVRNRPPTQRSVREPIIVHFLDLGSCKNRAEFEMERLAPLVLHSLADARGKYAGNESQ